MKEVKLNDNIVGDIRCRRFYAIKNEKGLYQHYTHCSRWTEYLCNARLYNSERGAIDEATRMLEDKKRCDDNNLRYRFSKDFGKSFEKVYVVEVRLSEVDE